MQYRTKWETFDSPVKGLAFAQNDPLGPSADHFIDSYVGTSGQDAEEFDLTKDVLKSQRHKMGLSQATSRDSSADVYR